jgi:phosphatidylethanolamine-binding protein (PEBP) family uncharacterized protein
MSRTIPRRKTRTYKRKQKQKRRITHKKVRGGNSSTILDIQYNNTTVNGQYLTKEETSSPPKITLNINPSATYTLVMYDPDAPHQTSYLHWIKTGITSTNKDGIDIVEYRGPSPPPNIGRLNTETGKKYHEYIFILIKYINKNKNIVPPQERTNFNIDDFIRIYGGEEIAKVSFRVMT